MNCIWIYTSWQMDNGQMDNGQMDNGKTDNGCYPVYSTLDSDKVSSL